MHCITVITILYCFHTHKRRELHMRIYVQAHIHVHAHGCESLNFYKSIIFQRKNTGKEGKCN